MGHDKYQILVISASPDAGEMRRQLAEDGFVSSQTVDYAQALDAIKTDFPDLILLTKQRGLSSLSMINKIHHQFPMIPIVIVATDIEGENLKEHIEAGADDYIYYVGAEKELLPHVVENTMKRHFNDAVLEASQETESLFRQLEQDQRSGFRVQQAMLPKTPDSIRGLTFNHQLYPSMIMSGDFIDYFELFDGRVAFYIADVSGHGASSAFVTVLLKSLSRRLLDEFRHNLTSSEVLAWVNTELLKWNLEQHVTMFFGIIDQQNNLLEYSNAAHFPGTILCHENGASFLEIGGQPLGLFAEPVYKSHRVELPDQYSIVMFSDGVFEILPQATLRDKEARLLSLVECHRQEHLDALIDDLGVLNVRSIPDDIAVFTVEGRGASPMSGVG